MSDAMGGYAVRRFEAALRSGARVERDVYERGEGPAVVIMQELPGIGPETLRLADRLIEAGHRVVIPHLFGPLGRLSIAGNTARIFCMRREFSLFARNASSPLVDWLRALCRDVRDRGLAEGGEAKGVGVIGMCLTGNFAITLMGEESVLAAVASQPAMPFLSQPSLHMSPEETEAVKKGLDEAGPMYAFRFDRDPLCTHKKFEAISAALNDDEHERVNLVVLPGKGHSVLTIDFVDEEGHPTQKALNSVLDYFGDRLKAP